MVNGGEPAWMIQSGDRVEGPFKLAQLRNLASVGRITRSTPIRSTTGTSWTVAGQFPAIFAGQASAVRSEPKRKIEVASSPDNTRQHPTPPPLRALSVVIAKAPSKAPASANQGVHAVLFGAIFMPAILGIVLIIYQFTAKRQLPLEASPVAATKPTVPAWGSEPKAVQEETATSQPRNHQPPNAYSTEELVARTQASVAVVATPTGSGSGFMVTPNILATNYHVIADAASDSIEVLFPDAVDGNARPWEAEVVRESPDRDLALLRIRAQVPALEVDRTYAFRRGQDVVIIGSPGVFRGEDILPNAVTKGVLSSTTTLFGHEVHQLSLAVNSGNSGGPVLGMDGRVIGVVVAKSRTEEAIGFSIPASDLAALLDQLTSEGSSANPLASELHDARFLVRSVTEQNLFRMVAFNGIIDAANIEPAQSSAENFVRESRSVFAEKAPSLVRNFDRDLEELATNPRLSMKIRREVDLLRQRHREIVSLLDAPPMSLDRLMSSLTHLNGQYLNQLRELNRTLEIGRPELFSE